MIKFKSKFYGSHNVVYEYDEEKHILYIPLINCTLSEVYVDENFDESVMSYLFDNAFSGLYNAYKSLNNSLKLFSEMGIYFTDVNQIDESCLDDDISYQSEVNW